LEFHCEWPIFLWPKAAQWLHDSQVDSPAKLPAQTLPTEVDFGRDICCDLLAAESREWLVTNGIGGYATGCWSRRFSRP
jgi:hypothetical protein